MQRKIAINSNTYHGYSLEDCIKGMKDAGFKYIELTATKGWTEHVFYDMPFEKLLDIRDMLKSENIEVIGFSGHTNIIDKDRLEDFKKNIELAHFFGSPIIVSSVGEAHLEDKVEDNNLILIENLKSLLPLLEDYNMILVLEVHGKHGTGRILNDIVEKVCSNFVKINYDTANAIFYGDVDIYEDIKENINNISYVHLKDKAGEKKEWNFPALGKGYIDFDKVFEIFKNENNPSNFSIEIEFTQEGPKNLEEINQALVDSYNYLKEREMI